MSWRVYALLSHAGDAVGLRRRRHPPPPRPAPDGEAVLRVLARVEEGAWTAGALAAAHESGLLAALSSPVTAGEAGARAGMPAPLAEGLLDVLVGLGLAVREGDLFRAAPGLSPMLDGSRPDLVGAAVDGPLFQAEDLRRRAGARRLDLEGWRHESPQVIEAQGAFTAAWAERAVPKLRFLPGLTPALRRPGAALLDVGAGAAGLAITLCRHFPELTAVALEPAPVPAGIGERRILEAGLGNRVVLRRERVEEIRDEAAYDLCFLPQMFLPERIMGDTARAVFRALRPGGWLLAAVIGRPGGDRGAALGRLKGLLWGGNARDGDAVRALLAEAGFRPVIRSPGGGEIRMICARRPPA